MYKAIPLSILLHSKLIPPLHEGEGNFWLNLDIIHVRWSLPGALLSLVWASGIVFHEEKNI
jgi:hypothetical protein